MQSRRLLSFALLLITAAAPCFAKTHPRRGPTSPKHPSPKRASSKAVKHTGQRSIDDNRASEIQSALVKSGYMTESSGHWDATTEAAMQKYQADNGWQTKLIPDSRAIIKLGLGPSNNNSAAPASGGVTTAQTISRSPSSDITLSQR